MSQHKGSTAYVFRVSLVATLVVLAWMAAGQAPAEVVLTDTFDDGELDANPVWTVESGVVTVEDGHMCFGRDGTPSVRLELGDTAWNKPVAATFRLRQTDATAGSFLLHVGLEDIDRNKGYTIACSPNAGYYGTSGFYDGKKVGGKGAALRGDTSWQQLTIRFDPVTDHLSLVQDDRTVWQGANQSRLPRVNRLTLSSGGTVSWQVDDLRVEAVLNDPSAEPDPGHAGVQTVYRTSVPHTDKDGRLLTRHDANRSFLQIGIWGVPMGEIWGTDYDLKVLVDAGFNTIWPWSRELAKTLAQAAEHDLQLVHMGELDEAALTELGKHPRLLANVWHDEPTGSFWGKDMQAKFDAFLAYRRQVHAVAPELPVFVNDVPWITPPATQWWIRWNTAGDVSCHDNYPIKHGGRVDSVGAIGPPVALAVESNGQKKPVWLIVGAFEQPGQGAFPFRFPTPAQLRACVYTGLIHGATGIVYFTWDTYVPRDGNVIGMSPAPKVAYVPNPRKPGYTHPSPANPVQLVQSKSLWAMAAAINRELGELVPSIFSPTIGDDELSYEVFTDLSHSEHPVRCLLKPHPEGGYVLLTCNVDATVLDCQFRLSKPIASVERMFANQPAWGVEPGSRSWQIVYEPFEVHVLRIHTSTQ
ncbi:MAG: hypothetical protein HQ582_11195 [Planctomycetes bacterium]|nr:hypothetical protein [Planctomycetota bacterium]